MPILGALNNCECSVGGGTEYERGPRLSTPPDNLPNPANEYAARTVVNIFGPRYPITYSSFWLALGRRARHIPIP